LKRKDFWVYFAGFVMLIIDLALFIGILLILKELLSLRVEYYNTLKVLSELNKHINYPGG